MSKAGIKGAGEQPLQPLFDAESTRKVIVALGRAAAASIASGIAISTGRPQDITATLRIQREAYDAFSNLAYRGRSLPAVSAFAQEEPVTKLLSAINRCGAASIATGVIGSSGRPHSVGDAMRTFYEVMAAMWPRDPNVAEPATAAGAGDRVSASEPL
ncbi:MAG: hypothetical protein M0002_03020 [Rhodospirillales bacterium]|nr:hypothetical protein [Rhodospirillales bacterium]